MEENLNVDYGITTKQEDYTQMTMEERKAMGLLVVTQEEARIAIKVCYVMEYGEPDKDNWPPIISELLKRFHVTSKVVKRVFLACVNGKDKTREAKGRGWSETQAQP